ncbi:hypothetical protein BDV96DRAFT_606010 [Lophiotrema nucula]|uniref:Uncharacterized protein n=1 Tax=Lophiotrema nucula TaxID=690887 RepID=A0A6A5YPF1_9PLEO|nr:hypothetical protein BDV96DRAFT_606010 [Lophiotrema nucula]
MDTAGLVPTIALGAFYILANRVMVGEASADMRNTITASQADKATKSDLNSVQTTLGTIQANVLTRADLLPLQASLNTFQGTALTQAHLTPVQNSLNTLQTDATTQNMQLSTLQQGLSTVQANGATTVQLNSVQQTLQQGINTLFANAATYTQVAALQTGLSTIQANAVSQNNLATLQQALQQDIRNVQSNALTRNDLVPLQTTLGSVQTDTTNLCNVLASVQRDVQGLQQTASTIQANALTQADITALQATISSIQSNALTQTDLNTAIIQLNVLTKDDMPLLQQALTALMPTDYVKQGDLAPITAALQRIEVNQAKVQPSSSDVAITELKQDIKPFQNLVLELAKLIKEGSLSNKNAEIEKLQKDVEDLKQAPKVSRQDDMGQILQLKITIARLEEKNAGNEKALEEAKEREKSLRDYNGKLLSDIAAANEKRHNVEKEILNFQHQAEASRLTDAKSASDAAYSKLEEENARIKERVDLNETASRSKLEEENARLKKQIDHHETASQLTDAKNASDAVARSELETEISGLKERLHSLETVPADPQPQPLDDNERKLIRETEAELAHKHGTLEVRVSHIDSRLAHLDDHDLKVMEEKQVEFADELSNLRIRVDEIEKEVPRTESSEHELKSMGEKQVGLAEELSNLGVRVDKIEKEVPRIDSNEDGVARLTLRVNDCEQGQNEAAQGFKELQWKHRAWDTDTVHLANCVTDLASKIEDGMTNGEIGREQEAQPGYISAKSTLYSYNPAGEPITADEGAFPHPVSKDEMKLTNNQGSVMTTTTMDAHRDEEYGNGNEVQESPGATYAIDQASPFPGQLKQNAALHFAECTVIQLPRLESPFPGPPEEDAALQLADCVTIQSPRQESPFPGELEQNAAPHHADRTLTQLPHQEGYRHQCRNHDICAGTIWESGHKFRKHVEVCNEARKQGPSTYAEQICPYCQELNTTETPKEKQWFWTKHVPYCYVDNSNAHARNKPTERGRGFGRRGEKMAARDSSRGLGDR